MADSKIRGGWELGDRALTLCPLDADPYEGDGRAKPTSRSDGALLKALATHCGAKIGTVEDARRAAYVFPQGCRFDASFSAHEALICPDVRHLMRDGLGRDEARRLRNEYRATLAASASTWVDALTNTVAPGTGRHRRAT